MLDPALTAAADALLRVVVSLARERADPSTEIRATMLPWRDPASIPRRDGLNFAGLAADPVGTACRAELRRIGHAVHAAVGDDDMIDATVEIAEMDPEFAGWRSAALEAAWVGIGGRLS